MFIEKRIIFVVVVVVSFIERRVVRVQEMIMNDNRSPALCYRLTSALEPVATDLSARRSGVYNCSVTQQCMWPIRIFGVQGICD